MIYVFFASLILCVLLSRRICYDKSYCLLFPPLALLPVGLGRIQLRSAEDCNLQRRHRWICWDLGAPSMWSFSGTSIPFECISAISSVASHTGSYWNPCISKMPPLHSSFEVTLVVFIFFFVNGILIGFIMEVFFLGYWNIPSLISQHSK